MPRCMILAFVSLLGLSGLAFAQPAKPDPDEAIKHELVQAYQILVHEGILDSFGHISARSAKDPSVFLMPRAMPPTLVTEADILAYRVSDSQPIDANGRRVNGERYIHGEVYKARPDVMAVIHAHSRAVIPLTVAGIKLKPVIAQAGFLPPESPTFEIRDFVKPGERGMQVTDSHRGAALARLLGRNPVVLMRGHGETVVGHSLRQAVVYAYYIEVDATMERESLQLSHDIIALSAPELFKEAEFDSNRVWEALRADMLTPAQRASIDRSQFGLSDTQKAK